MHIVIDARNRRGPGVGRYTDRLLEHLQAARPEHNFTVLVQSDDHWRPRAANFETVPADFPQFSFNPLNDFRFAYLLNNLKPDLVHFTMTQHPLTYRGKMVITTHDLTMLRFVRAGKTPKPVFWLKRLGYKTLFYVAHQKARRIIVPTQFVAEDLAKLYPFTDGKTAVTYEASEPPISDDPEKPSGVSAPFLLHVGSPFPHKNIQHLIESFEELLKTNPKLSLVLAGKKEFYFQELEDWARSRSSYKHIRFTGFIPDNELKWLYENATAYVLPSLSEGFGLPGLEAMSHGCPLISSNATCLPEVYGNAALYFDPLDKDETVEAIQQVIDNKALRARLIKAGHQQVQKYSWRKMADETLVVYDEALS